MMFLPCKCTTLRWQAWDRLQESGFVSILSVSFSNPPLTRDLSSLDPLPVRRADKSVEKNYFFSTGTKSFKVYQYLGHVGVLNGRQAPDVMVSFAIDKTVGNKISESVIVDWNLDWSQGESPSVFYKQ